MLNKPKTLIMLITLMLLLPSLGQADTYSTIQDIRAEAQQGWKQEYQSHGRTIRVDVLPGVPKVDTVPLLKVGRMIADINLPTDDAKWQVDRNNPGDLLLDYRKNSQEEPAGYVFIDGKRHSARPYSMHYERDYAPDATLIPGNDLSFGEIVALVEKSLRVINFPPDTVDAAHPSQFQTHGYYGASGQEFVSPGWASLAWEVKMRGIPCMGPYAVPFKQGWGEPTLWCPYMSLVIRRPDLFWVGINAMAEKQMVEEDLPLLSFADVRKGYEKEIQAGKVRHVFELKFEYALQPTPGMSLKESQTTKALYYAKPFWRLECLWEPDAKTAHRVAETEGNGPYPDLRNSLSRISLLMDAQTGEIVNPLSEAYDRAEFKGIVTWQDVKSK